MLRGLFYQDKRNILLFQSGAVARLVSLIADIYAPIRNLVLGAL